jgi:plastocyanin
MRSKLVWIAATIALAASVASATAAETIKVTIKAMKFTPAEITAHVGDTIEWTNQDPMNHTSTGTNKEWDVTIGAGKTGTVVVDKAGTFAYFCRFHPSMKGTVTVQ